MSHLLEQLAEFDKQHPLERKLLLCPDLNYGRELLLALARRTGGWLGWEPATLRGLAEELALVPLAAAGLRTADDVDVALLLDRALDDAAHAGELSSTFTELARQLGFRVAVRNAVLTLRMAGVDADLLRRTVATGSPAAQVPPVMARFGALLEDAHLADPARIFTAAVAAFDAEAPFVLDGAVVVAPGLVARGLPGRLLGRLSVTAHILDGDDAGALFAPSVRPVLFHASTPGDEVREALRRVVRQGIPWDEVELAATDPDRYGVALYGLAARLDIPVTSLHGVPLARTRVGRAVGRYLEWLEDGLPADLVREALEQEEIVPAAWGHPGDGAGEGASLARAFRRLRIGWGRGRYEAAVANLTDPAYVDGRCKLRDGETATDEELAMRHASVTEEARALTMLLRRLLGTLPKALPERGRFDPVDATVAGLAAAALAYVDLVGVSSAAEARAHEKLSRRLRRLAEAEGEPPRPFGYALAALRESLGDLRAWPGSDEPREPRTSAGGRLHLTDLEHAGTTGRRWVFLLGLAADAVAGPRLQDPILPDSDRRRLNEALSLDALPETPVRSAERRATVRRACGRLAGWATLSYATTGDETAGTSEASWVMLEALRSRPRFRTASYDILRRRLGEPASAVPRKGCNLDGRDVWLGALAKGPLLRDGRELVGREFPDVARGVAAAAARRGDTFTVHHGLVLAAKGRFDPLLHPERPISASSLEALAHCPLRWFYSYALGLRVPDDPEYDPLVWLDPRQKGELLHDVFERFVREFQNRQGDVATPAAEERLAALTREELARWVRREPPPCQAVHDEQALEILETAMAFLVLERDQRAADGHEWLGAEFAFGGGGRTVALILPGGRPLGLQGRIDRVDRLADGTLRVLDYKTGSAGRYVRKAKDAPLKGGRALQPALYACAAEQVLKDRVTRSEYWFPAVTGGRTVPYAAKELAVAPSIVASLLGHPARGEFPPTRDVADCAYCDYRPACQVRQSERGGFTSTLSPLAAWSKAHVATVDAVRRAAARDGDVGDGEEAEA